MSEIRSFESVEISTPRLPTIAFSEVIACREAHHIKARASTPLHGRREVLSAMMAASSFEATHAALVGCPLHLDPEKIRALRPQIEQAIQGRDRLALIGATQQLIQAEEQREAASALQILGEAARSLRFTVNVLRPDRGLIQLTTGRGRETITVEVSHGKNGRLRVVSDTNGFQGDHCVANNTRLFEAARNLGLKASPGQSKRKSPGGVRAGIGLNTQSIGRSLL